MQISIKQHIDIQDVRSGKQVNRLAMLDMEQIKQITLRR